MGTESRRNLQYVVRIFQPELGGRAQHSDRAEQQHPTWGARSRAAGVLPDGGAKAEADVCVQGLTAGRLAQRPRSGLDADKPWYDVEGLRLALASLDDEWGCHFSKSWSPTGHGSHRQKQSAHHHRGAEGSNNSHRDTANPDRGGHG